MTSQEAIERFMARLAADPEIGVIAGLLAGKMPVLIATVGADNVATILDRAVMAWYEVRKAED